MRKIIKYLTFVLVIYFFMFSNVNANYTIELSNLQSNLRDINVVPNGGYGNRIIVDNLYIVNHSGLDLVETTSQIYSYKSGVTKKSGIPTNISSDEDMENKNAYSHDVFWVMPYAADIAENNNSKFTNAYCLDLNLNGISGPVSAESEQLILFDVENESVLRYHSGLYAILEYDDNLGLSDQNLYYAKVLALRIFLGLYGASSNQDIFDTNSYPWYKDALINTFNLWYDEDTDITSSFNILKTLDGNFSISRTSEYPNYQLYSFDNTSKNVYTAMYDMVLEGIDAAIEGSVSSKNDSDSGFYVILSPLNSIIDKEGDIINYSANLQASVDVKGFASQDRITNITLSLNGSNIYINPNEDLFNIKKNGSMQKTSLNNLKNEDLSKISQITFIHDVNENISLSSCGNLNFKFDINYTSNTTNSGLTEYIYVKSDKSGDQRFLVESSNNVSGPSGSIKNYSESISIPIDCNNTPDCDTTINIAGSCEANGNFNGEIVAPTDILNCIIDGSDEANNSYAISKPGGNICSVNDSDEGLSHLLNDNEYCEVFCKEDYTNINLPDIAHANSGRYFKLEALITGKKTCYTTEINYDEFNSDLNAATAEMSAAYRRFEIATNSLQSLENTLISKNNDMVSAIKDKESPEISYDLVKIADARQIAASAALTYAENKLDALETIDSNVDTISTNSTSISSKEKSVTSKQNLIDSYNNQIDAINKANADKPEDEHQSTSYQESRISALTEEIRNLNSSITELKSDNDDLTKKNTELKEKYNIQTWETIASQQIVVNNAKTEKTNAENNYYKVCYTEKHCDNDDNYLSLKISYDNAEEAYDTALNNLESTLKSIDAEISNMNLAKSKQDSILDHIIACGEWDVNFKINPTMTFDYGSGYMNYFEDKGVTNLVNTNSSTYVTDVWGCDFNNNSSAYINNEYNRCYGGRVLDSENELYEEITITYYKGNKGTITLQSGESRIEPVSYTGNTVDYVEYDGVEGHDGSYTFYDSNNKSEKYPFGNYNDKLNYNVYGSVIQYNIFIPKAEFISKSSEGTEEYETPSALYTTFPTGEVTKEAVSNSSIINGLPVGSDENSGKYTLIIDDLGEYYDDCSLGRLIDADQTKNSVDDVLNVAGTTGRYICDYIIDCPDCDYVGECDDGLCGEDICETCLFVGGISQLYYRIISLNNFNPNNRNLGYNFDTADYDFGFIRGKAESTLDFISRDSIVFGKGEAIYGEEPLASVTMTPSFANDVRTYNREEENKGAYNNETLVCYDYGTYENVMCYSTFLDNYSKSGDIIFSSSEIRPSVDERDDYEDTDGNDYWDFYTYGINTDFGSTSPNTIGGPSWK